VKFHNLFDIILIIIFVHVKITEICCDHKRRTINEIFTP